ncbi:MAG TPA: hypothetical protein VGG29_14490 [Caulobacteraceae bacterium]|jgi:hypothetical protein
MDNAPEHAADQGLGRVDRGQRVAGETRFADGHDGKERAHFVKRKEGQLHADMTGGAGAAPVTTEDVVEAPDTASAWEAREDGERDDRGR